MRSFERLPLAIQTVYAELARRAWAGSFQEIMDAGGTPHKRTVKGRDYWYWHPAMRNGKRPPAKYLGPDTDEIRDRIENRTELASARKHRISMVRALRAGGVPGPAGLSGQVLAALAEADAFRTGAVVLGSLAFQCYAPLLGFVPNRAAARAGDVDIGGNPLPSHWIGWNETKPDLLSVLKEVDPAFEAVSSMFPAFKYAVQDGGRGRFEVDVLTPEQEGESATMHLPALGSHGSKVASLDFLMHQEIEAVVLHGPGVPVKVPAPERFAVHKLLVADRRRGDPAGGAKTRKDLAQAAALVRVLGADRPDELEAAWLEMLARGPSWRAAVMRSRDRLDEDARELLPLPSAPEKGSTVAARDPRDGVDERFRCAAEDRAAQQACLGVAVRVEEIGERLMELRKQAWDRYGATALWSVPPHATYGAMAAVAESLRTNGDLEAAWLAAAILREIETRTGHAA